MTLIMPSWMVPIVHHLCSTVPVAINVNLGEGRVVGWERVGKGEWGGRMGSGEDGRGKVE